MRSSCFFWGTPVSGVVVVALFVAVIVEWLRGLAVARRTDDVVRRVQELERTTTRNRAER